MPSATLGEGGNRKTRNNQSDYGQTSHEDMVRLFCRCAERGRICSFYPIEIMFIASYSCFRTGTGGDSMTICSAGISRLSSMP